MTARSIKKFFIFIFMMLLVAGSSFSQSRFQAGFHFITGFPQDEFKENVKNTGFGGGGEFYYHIPNSPILIGAGLNFLIYGTQSRREALSPNIPEVTVEIQTSNNIFSGDLIFRAQPPTGYINGLLNPYVEGLVGFNYLWTETGVKDEDEWEYEEDVFSSKNYDDTALNYGFGAGVMFKIATGGDDDDFEKIYVDLGVRYIFGENAKYLKKGGIIREDGKVTYNPSESTTDLLIPKLGVIFTF